MSLSADKARERLVEARAERQRLQSIEPLTVTVPEAAKLIGISRRHAYELVASGEIPSVRFGGAIRIPRARLLAMIEGQTS